MTQPPLLRAILELLRTATDADGIECVADGEAAVSLQLGQQVVANRDIFSKQIYGGRLQPSLMTCHEWVQSLLAVPLDGPYGDGGWLVIASQQSEAFTDKAQHSLRTAAQAIEGFLDFQVEHARLDEASSGLRSSQEALRENTTQLQESNRQLSRRASTDSLTGLVNRHEIEKLFESYESSETASLGSGSGPAECAIALLDLNGFKTVNDQHGHVVGDALLRIVGRRLLSQVRGHDVAGRWGGDEFIVVLAGPLSHDAAQSRVNEIRDVLGMPYNIRGNQIKIKASIGIAMWSAGELLVDVVADADAAMYLEKRTTAASATCS